MQRRFTAVVVALMIGCAPNARHVLPRVLGVTPEQFYEGWAAFARKKYG